MKNFILDKLNRFKLFLLTKFYKFHTDNKGMGVIEIVLIILVLIGLILIFKNQITSIINTVFSKVTTQINRF